MYKHHKYAVTKSSHITVSVLFKIEPLCVTNLTVKIKLLTKIITNFVREAMPCSVVEAHRRFRPSTAPTFSFMNYIGTFTTDCTASYCRLWQLQEHRHDDFKCH